VTKIGKDAPSDSMRYRVEIAGSDQRTFEVRVPLASVATKATLEVEIERLFSQGWLPVNGRLHCFVLIKHFVRKLPSKCVGALG
jgi:hypothetical protein